MIPFDTQILNGDDDDDSPYFNDDEDEPGLDAMGATPDGAAGTDELSDDILKETQGQLKRVRPENINYAKRAKRVDVKKLKDSIWKELEDVTIPVKEVGSFNSSRPGGLDAWLTFRMPHTSYLPLLPTSLKRKPKRNRWSLSSVDCARSIRKTRWKRSRPRSASFACCIWRMRRGFGFRRLLPFTTTLMMGKMKGYRCARMWEVSRDCAFSVKSRRLDADFKSKPARAYIYVFHTAVRVRFVFLSSLVLQLVFFFATMQVASGFDCLASDAHLPQSFKPLITDRSTSVCISA